MFNDARYAERVKSGELQLVVKKSRITNMTYIRNYIPGTESQELHILTMDGTLLVKAHRFLRPDGQLAASGLIDPKRIYDNGEIVGIKDPDEE
jgi:hypothetical protein